LKRLLIAWTAINLASPVSVLLIFALVSFEPNHRTWIAYLTVAAMFVANAAAMTRYTDQRWPFGIMLLLNPFALIMLGDISFVTAIPELPFLAKSLYLLALERI
jgi:hypothetical protein|tara:strand:- start:475 stop:786 length:312 start_codon:yes stop_codon:yes gene_type:complete